MIILTGLFGQDAGWIEKERTEKKSLVNNKNVRLCVLSLNLNSATNQLCHFGYIN